MAKFLRASSSLNFPALERLEDAPRHAGAGGAPSYNLLRMDRLLENFG